MAACLSDFEWLVSDAAAAWLARAAAESASLPALASALRRELSPERTHLVLEQAELRGRGAAKFARAAEMFFARTALEQATDESIAAHKARRFPAGVLADLCCGVGGDLTALAARGKGVGVERDPALALLAAANCRVLGHAAEVQTSDAAAFAVEEVAAWHIDPDRRPQGRRTTRVELHEPNAAALERLLARNPAAAIKLAPATELSPAWQANAEQEWISRGGECRQLVAWFGPLAHAAGGRRATILGHDPHAPRVVQGAADRPIPLAAEVGAYLFEPDAAVLASHLTGALAAEHQLAALAREVAYLTGPRPLNDPALAVFEVTEVLPFQVKRLKALLRERRIGRLEIKKRGVAHDPETLRKQLAVPGEEAGVLLLAPLRQGVTAILARRCSQGCKL